MSKRNGAKSARSRHNGGQPKYTEVWARSTRTDISWSSEGMNHYFRDISRYRLLTPAEEFECACDIERAYLNIMLSLVQFSSVNELLCQWRDNIRDQKLFVSDCFVVHPEKNGRRFDPTDTLALLNKWCTLSAKAAKLSEELSEERIARLVFGKKNTKLSKAAQWAVRSVTVLRLSDDRLNECLSIARQELAVRLHHDSEDSVNRLTALLQRAERCSAWSANRKNLMITSNVRLAITIAKHYHGKTPLAFSDVLGEANCGLIEAVNRFNCHRGARFATYAIWWIRQKVVHGITNTGHFIRRPGHVQNHLNKLLHLVPEANTIKLTPENVSELLGIDRVTANAIVGLLSSPVISLDELRYKETGTAVIDTIVDPQAQRTDARAQQSVKRQRLEQALGRLTPREAETLRLRFGLDSGIPLTLEQVGRRFGLTRERVRQIEKKALRKLQRYSRFLKDSPSES